MSKKNLRVDYYLLLNIAEDSVSYILLPGLNRFQNLTPNARFERTVREEK